MRTIFLSAAILSLLLTGCGRAALSTSANAPSSPAEITTSSDDAVANDSSSQQPWAPGDYVTYRFSGSFRNEPVTLTQKFVAREGKTIVMDMTFAGDGANETLRVHISDAPETRGEILRVAYLQEGNEKPTTLDTYQALMDKTTLAADTNEEMLGTEEVIVEVNGRSLTCKKTSYRVLIGAKEATLQTLQSAHFFWGDVGGEIIADGDVLYRAEVIDMGNAPGRIPSKQSSLAKFDYEE